MTLGQKLKQARLARGMTQAQVVGERITRNMLSQIENDQASPSVGTLEYLAAALDVKLAWLLADEKEEAEAGRTSRMRALLRGGDYGGCLALAPQTEPDDEQALALAMAAAQCARHAMEAERFDTAQHLAQQALSWNATSVYESGQLRLELLEVLARCAQAQQLPAEEAFAACRQAYAQLQPEARYHLTMARYQLEQEQLQAAERELWSITEPPEACRAEYLILRGRIAAKKQQYETAAEYLRQAEALGPLPKLYERELCQTMELASRELQDYKSAYEYAARQLKL